MRAALLLPALLVISGDPPSTWEAKGSEIYTTRSWSHSLAQWSPWEWAQWTAPWPVNSHYYSTEEWLEHFEYYDEAEWVEYWTQEYQGRVNTLDGPSGEPRASLVLSPPSLPCSRSFSPPRFGCYSVASHFSGSELTWVAPCSKTVKPTSRNVARNILPSRV